MRWKWGLNVDEKEYVYGQEEGALVNTSAFLYPVTI